MLDFYQKHYPEPKLEIQAWSEEIDWQFIIEDLRNFSRLDEADMKQGDKEDKQDS